MVMPVMLPSSTSKPPQAGAVAQNAGAVKPGAAQRMRKQAKKVKPVGYKNAPVPSR